MGQQSERAGQAEPSHALRRVVGRLREAAWSDGDPVRALSRGLPGSDLATVLLEVFRRRADRIGPSDVLRRYRGDRFVAPGSVPFADLRRAEDGLLAALPEGFEVLTLAPVLPLGSHSAIAAVDPRNVIATIRGSEVAADSTNGLALEAAVLCDQESVRRDHRRRSAPAGGPITAGCASRSMRPLTVPRRSR